MRVEGEIRPLRDQVLVYREPVPEQTTSGLHIPETARDWRATEGIALACGPKCSTIRPGDRLKLQPNGGREFRDREGRLVGLWKEDEIDCVIDPEPLLDA